MNDTYRSTPWKVETIVRGGGQCNFCRTENTLKILVTTQINPFKIYLQKTPKTNQISPQNSTQRKNLHKKWTHSKKNPIFLQEFPAFFLLSIKFFCSISLLRKPLFLSFSMYFFFLINFLSAFIDFSINSLFFRSIFFFYDFFFSTFFSIGFSENGKFGIFLNFHWLIFFLSY